MDRITKSLQEYLKATKIKYQTLYNSDTGYKQGNPTSTSFHVKNSDDSDQVADIVIDIFPKESKFFLSAHPREVFDCEAMDKIKAFENKWNACGLFTSMSVSEEMGVVENDRYCFRLMLSGISDRNGLSNYVWHRYFEIIKDDIFMAWSRIAVLSISDEVISY